jgi:hypothetical protein
MSLNVMNKYLNIICLVSLLTACMEEEPLPQDYMARGYNTTKGVIHEFTENRATGHCRDAICINSLVIDRERKTGRVESISDDLRKAWVKMDVDGSDKQYDIFDLGKEIQCLNGWCNDYKMKARGKLSRLLNIYSSGEALIQDVETLVKTWVTTYEFEELKMPSFLTIPNAYTSIDGDSQSLTALAIRQCAATGETTANGFNCTYNPSLLVEKKTDQYFGATIYYMCNGKESSRFNIRYNFSVNIFCAPPTSTAK